MQAKVREKELAIRLRRQGLSYKDILKQVPVAKSSLSAWLKDLPLTNREKEYLQKRRGVNISHGRMKAATMLHERKLDREKDYFIDARKEFNIWKDNAFFCTGIALYWAEGAKRSQVFAFTNSDWKMFSLFIRWIERFAGANRNNLYYQLYIHKLYASENCEEYWASRLQISTKSFKKTVYKPSGRLIKKRPQYKGCLRVSVPRSSGLLYKMKVWHNMLAQQYDSDV